MKRLPDNGSLLKPQYTKVYGYWAWEGIAELLPFEYLPTRLNQKSIEALQNVPIINGFVLSNLTIKQEDIIKGGPTKDGIPALDFPNFIHSKEVTYIKATDKIIGVNFNGGQKAYPISILNYHEVVNDSIEDFKFTVTYCPLCGSGVVFDASPSEQHLTFGVSGLLYNSDVLLYDDQTKSLWSQIEAKAVSGAKAGATLEMMPSEVTTWLKWKTKFPNTRV